MPPLQSQVVAIVDDDELMRGALQGLLKQAGVLAQTFASAEEFLDSGAPRLCSCLIADIRMAGLSGLDLQATLNRERIPIPVIFVTAHGDERLRLQAMSSGAVGFLAKPFDDDELLQTVRGALSVGPCR